jgi:hypothetical protein
MAAAEELNKFLEGEGLKAGGMLPYGVLASFGRKLFGRRELTAKEMSFVKRVRSWLPLVGLVKGSKSAKQLCFATKLGPRRKAPAIRADLFTWFCSVRGSVKGRIPLMCLRAEANRIRDLYIESSLKFNLTPAVPAISYRWLQQWMKENHAP